MAVLNVQKVNTLPGSLTSNTLYLVKSSDAGFMELYLTNNNASEVRHGFMKSDFTSLMDTKDIAYFARDSLGNIYDIVDKAGVSQQEAERMTWAAFIDPTFDLTKYRNIIVIDKHSRSPFGGGSSWYVDPSAPVGSKRICRDDYIYTLWANRPAAGSYPGLGIRLLDYESIPFYRSVGGVYRPVGRQLLYGKIFNTLASPSVSMANWNPTADGIDREFILPTDSSYPLTQNRPTILADMGQPNSKFFIEAHFHRNTATGGVPVPNIRLGKNKTAADLSMWGSGVPNTANVDSYPKTQVLLNTQTIGITTYNNLWGTTNQVNASADRSGNSAFNFGLDMFVSVWAGIVNTPDTIGLQHLYLWHEC